MKRKTINAVITKRMKEWWETIDDENLRTRVEKETVVTGGCIASMLLGEQVRDFDVYLGTYDTVRDLTNYYVNRFKEGRKTDEMRPISVVEDGVRVKIVVKSAGIAGEGDDSMEYRYFEARPPEEAQDYVGEVYDDPSTIEELHEETENAALEAKDSFRPVFLSTNAITLSDRVQLIVRFYGTPEEIHSNYDFVHCTNYWTKKDGVVLNPEAMEALLTKELRYVGSKYPICSLMRIRKFIQRGWTINAGQILKACMQISALDLTKLEVLEDQLTGVDVAYFIEVVDLLGKHEAAPQVETAYLLEILDRMF